MLAGKTLGTVVASAAPGVPAGASVVHMLGWRECTLLDPAQYRVVDTEDPLLVLSNGLTVVDGLAAAPQALLDLFAGRYVGAVLVQLAE